MGLLADFIVASPADALQYRSLLEERSPIPPDRFERAEYKNITPLALGMLWAILRDEKWEVGRHCLENVYHTQGGNNWLERFPDELVDLISALDEEEASRAADAWSRTGEIWGSPDELKPLLADLKNLAIQARRSDRGLYLWGSL